MDPKRIDDLTLDALNIEGGGDEGDLGFFKEACRHYQQATRSTDQEAIGHVYGDGDWDDRAAAWVGEPKSWFHSAFVSVPLRIGPSGRAASWGRSQGGVQYDVRRCERSVTDGRDPSPTRGDGTHRRD